MKETIFIGFSLFTLATASGVILSKTPVYSVFSLILTFFGLSALYVLWGADFIAMIQILVYTGAIVVLFLFVVMLLNFRKETVQGNRMLPLLFGGGVAWLFSILLLRTLNTFAPSLLSSGVSADIRSVSLLLFTDYLWPFEVLSLFLLILIVAIIALAGSEKHT